MKFAPIFLLILVMTTDLEARGLGNVRGGGGGGNLSWNQGTRCRGGRGRWSSRLYHNRIRCRLNLGSRNRGMGGMAVGDNIPNFIQNNNNNQGSDEDQEAPCVGICYLQKMQREEAQKAEQNKERQEARERRQQERQDSQEDLKRREVQEELEQQLERQKDKEAKQQEQERQKSQEELEQENMEQEAMQADQEMKNKQGSNIQKLEEIPREKPEIFKGRPRPHVPCVGICYLRKLERQAATEARTNQRKRNLASVYYDDYYYQ